MVLLEKANGYNGILMETIGISVRVSIGLKVTNVLLILKLSSKGSMPLI